MVTRHTLAYFTATLIALPDLPQDRTVRKVFYQILSDALVQYFVHARSDDLQKLVMTRVGMYSIYFSQSLASTAPLRLQLKPDTKPIHVKI